jgi:uncharacterized protein YjbI with pentapeptide repeats
MAQNRSPTRRAASFLTGADLSGAKFDSANLTKAIVAQIQLDMACGTNVKLDLGLGIKPCLH